jgi:hypothetical protein
MSEYQYYEFQAIDRPLTQDEMDKLRQYSTRAEITPSRFVNVYHWGDFKGNPDRWMADYFDAFLYLANWGTRRLMFRVPARLLEPDVVSDYCVEDTLSFTVNRGNLILSFDSEQEDTEWADGEGWLESLVLLRSDLMHGDYRCLYLGWLLGVQAEILDDDDEEPPVPPGLADLTGPLKRLAEFLRVDPDLIHAASETSGDKPSPAVSDEAIRQWVTRLPPGDKDEMLLRLVDGHDTHLVAELRQRALAELRPKRDSSGGPQPAGRRRVGELTDRAEAVAEDRRRRLAGQRARRKAEEERLRAEAREKHLQSLAGREDYLWSRVEQLIKVRQPKTYDEAVEILCDLRELAVRQDTPGEFTRRMCALYADHARKPTLIERFRKANL